ncbi:DUF3153 domain-containing protein [Calothrix sp. 336/3]|uniref:DUF3153 domain-containing protein n=1 Tax=Calothrix sp. 336/3 TaxID=1337936 RepID=UPI0004E36813|nr:DUF3153 domain-containing protein [Calothrix sp. 336/3]AKG20673.1 hypothetical protein IJ00_04550 [Calothrix sp. 336/3]
MGNFFRKNISRLRNICLLILVSLLLSGCVEYDVGVNFAHPNHGEFVQHIKLGDRLTSFSGDSVYEWLNSIERRTRQLSGKVKRISPEEVIVTIPFSNGEELQTKFNEFFQSQKDSSNTPKDGASDLPQVASNFLLFQNNFILLVRNRLVYDLDLRSLALIANNGNILTNTDSIIDLKFSLTTPWGAKNITVAENSPQLEKTNHQLTWQLNPGELNHIEAVFWLPSPLGIGALLIILFVWLGFYLRYSLLPAPKSILSPES